MDKKLRLNMLLNVGYNMLSIIVPFFTAPYLGRVLGAERVGTYTYIHSIVLYFSYFALLGITNLGSREIAKVRDNHEKRNRIFSEIYTMQICSTAIVLSAYLLFIIFAPLENRLFYVIMSIWIIASVFDISWFCAGMEQFKSFVMMGFISKIINLLFVFLCIRAKSDLIKYFFIAALGQLVSHVFIWLVVKKQVKFSFQPFKSFKIHIKPNVMLFIPVIAASIYGTMDKLMIGAMVSKSDLAYYEYADKLISIPNLAFTAMGAVLLSRSSHLLSNNIKEGNKTIGLSMDLCLTMASASAFGLAAISDELIYIYYGKDFIASGKILFWLSPAIIIYAWANVLRMQYIIPKGKDFVYIKATIFGAVVNLLLNAVLIPKFGSLGATFGTIVAQLTVAGVFTYYCKDHLPLTKYIKLNLPCMVIGALMFISIKFIQNTHDFSLFGLILDIAVGAFCFVLLLFIFALFSKNHITGIALSSLKEKLNK